MRLVTSLTVGESVDVGVMGDGLGKEGVAYSKALGAQALGLLFLVNPSHSSGPWIHMPEPSALQQSPKMGPAPAPMLRPC